MRITLSLNYFTRTKIHLIKPSNISAIHVNHQDHFKVQTFNVENLPLAYLVSESQWHQMYKKMYRLIEANSGEYIRYLQGYVEGLFVHKQLAYAQIGDHRPHKGKPCSKQPCSDKGLYFIEKSLFQRKVFIPKEMLARLCKWTPNICLSPTASLRVSCQLFKKQYLCQPPCGQVSATHLKNPPLCSVISHTYCWSMPKTQCMFRWYMD